MNNKLFFLTLLKCPICYLVVLKDAFRTGFLILDVKGWLGF